ncbi:MAG: hypothetical protein ACJ8AT_31985 [Hyalangium sp.]|uniref:hypothetical protein n=1 Tax=Hyalangium sp. TaxID=2028555 RepID=UPI00389A7380
MKRLLFIATLAASASACVNGNNPVQLLDARPVDSKTCERSEKAILRGSLNYNVNTHYITTFSVFSPLTENTTSGSGTGFYGEEVDLSYTAKKVTTTFTDESLPILYVVPAGAQPGDSFFTVDLIGDEARKKLEAVVPSEPDSMTLLVTIKLKGKLASGKAAETNEVTFPIEITRGASCPPNQTPMPGAEDKCFPGQDGVAFSCG